MNLRLFLIVLALAAAACTTTRPQPPPASTTSTAPAATDAPAASTTGPPATTGTPGSPTTSGPGYTPTYEEAPCRFNVPDGHEVTCGYVTVPEDRADPAGMEVRLHVAVFPAETDTPAPDPVVYLEGGPGGHALAGLEFSFEDRFAPFLAERDLIVFDQRGVGFSTPALGCPEVRQLDIDLLDEVLDPQAVTALEIGALEECRDRLAADGVDLSQYNSRTNAQDVADIRIALGIDEWNLYGISYGTRLALTVLRDNPAGIRSVILDSTVPPQEDLVASIPATAERAFDAFFTSCGAAAACAATFPGLEATYTALRASLDAQPASIEVTDFLSGDTYPALLTGDDLVGMLFQSLYSEQLIPILPDVIKDAAAGDLGGLEQLASLFFTNDRFLSIGMYLAVQCNEEYTFSSVAAVADAVRAHPDGAALVPDAAGEFEECAVWGAGAADPVEDDPITSTIPTLVLAGAFDPITPPQFGMEAAATLPNSYFFEFPGLGHGVSTAHECPLSITLGFLTDPMRPPDGACVSAMGGPAFLTPGRLSVHLVPFEEDIFDLTVSGVIPEGWDAVGFGQYTAPGLGDTALVQQARRAGPGLTVDSMAAGIGDFFDIADWDRTTYTGTRTWDIFDGTDGQLNYVMGLVEADGYLLTVILAAPPDVFPEYRNLVFFPALDAIEAS